MDNPYLALVIRRATRTQVLTIHVKLIVEGNRAVSLEVVSKVAMVKSRRVVLSEVMRAESDKVSYEDDDLRARRLKDSSVCLHTKRDGMTNAAGLLQGGDGPRKLWCKFLTTSTGRVQND